MHLRPKGGLACCKSSTHFTQHATTHPGGDIADLVGTSYLEAYPPPPLSLLFFFPLLVWNQTTHAFHLDPSFFLDRTWGWTNHERDQPFAVNLAGDVVCGFLVELPQASRIVGRGPQPLIG